MTEQVKMIPIHELRPFKGHPFYVKEDENMESLRESIRAYGVQNPLIARPHGEGYELISGHRRRAAALKLGMTELPVLVREMTDDEATILMVDSNIQRENLLPSEKAFAHNMKLEALNHQGTTSGQVGQKWSRDLLAEQSDDSSRQIHRYIRLTQLIKPILNLMDEGRMALSPGVELSYLSREEQAELWDIISNEDKTPSFSQAVRLKKLSQAGELSPEKIMDIMDEDTDLRFSLLFSHTMHLLIMKCTACIDSETDKCKVVSAVLEDFVCCILFVQGKNGSRNLPP